MGRLIEMKPSRYTALEFFAGIGCARSGMSRAGVRTIWANDIDKTKCELYRAQWGDVDLVCQDVFDVNPKTVPVADVAWASSPCTNVSLAGKREGLVAGHESSAFFGFIQVVENLEYKPRVLVLENVTGLASSHDGDDFRTVVREFNRLGYSVDAFELDARRWLPQSRPRMFVVGVQNPLGGGRLDSSIRPDRLAWIHADSTLITHISDLPAVPELRSGGFTALSEKMTDDDERWWDSDRLDAFVQSLSQVQLQRFEELKAGHSVVARTAYRRTRGGRPTWEIRQDDIAGCLRTARGGSSKQAVVVLGCGQAKVRWMTGAEYAALQGAHGFDLVHFKETQIMYAFGDAVAIPAVAWLMKSVVVPELDRSKEIAACHCAAG